MSINTLIYYFFRSLTVVLMSMVVIFLIALTSYAPDAYVFINELIFYENKTLGVDSITGNVFFFDVVREIFRFFKVSDLIDYFFGVLIIYLFVFYLKYFHFLSQVNIKDLLLIFAASLITYDINSLRFSFAIILFLYSFSSKLSPLWIYFLRFISFLSHILPFIVFYTARLYYLPLFLLPSLIIVLDQVNSRFNLYFVQEEFVFFKVFLLLIPNLMSTYFYKKRKIKNKIAEFAIAFNILFFVFIFFNGALAARFLEASFVLFVIWWAFLRERSSFLGLVLWTFSISMFVSRLINGINAGTQKAFLFSPTEMF